MRAYLPTPKMAAVFWALLVVVLAVVVADYLDLADVRPAAAAAVVAVVGFAAGWVKSDES